MLNLGVGKGIHIIAVIIVIFIFYYVSRYIHRRFGRRLSIDIITVMLFSGALCSLIDKLFWNGSLDFVYLKGFFVFDIKDCYLTLSEITAAVLIFRNWNQLSHISTKETLFGIISLIKEDFTLKRGD
jgi:signal peptidase II